MIIMSEFDKQGDPLRAEFIAMLAFRDFSERRPTVVYRRFNKEVIQTFNKQANSSRDARKPAAVLKSAIDTQWKNSNLTLSRNATSYIYESGAFVFVF